MLGEVDVPGRRVRRDKTRADQVERNAVKLQPEQIEGLRDVR